MIGNRSQQQGFVVVPDKGRENQTCIPVSPKVVAPLKSLLSVTYNACNYIEG